MPKIIVVSPTEVRVDGQNFGAVADTIANNPKLAPDIQRAIEKLHAEQASALQAAKAETAEAKAALEKTNARAAKAEQDAKPERQKIKDRLKAQRDELDAQIAKL